MKRFLIAFALLLGVASISAPPAAVAAPAKPATTAFPDLFILISIDDGYNAGINGMWADFPFSDAILEDAYLLGYGIGLYIYFSEGGSPIDCD